jgi:hypothetical protein
VATGPVGRILFVGDAYRANCLPPVLTLISYLASCSTPKMEAVCASETSVNFQLSACRYVAVHGTVPYEALVPILQLSHKGAVYPRSRNHVPFRDHFVPI